LRIVFLQTLHTKPMAPLRERRQYVMRVLPPTNLAVSEKPPNADLCQG